MKQVFQQKSVYGRSAAYGAVGVEKVLPDTMGTVYRTVTLKCRFSKKFDARRVSVADRGTVIANI